ncbi:MAG: glycosyl transferase [Microbacterium sp.]
MQSFGAPRPTTNPYIRMLDEALTSTPGVEHLRFDRRTALLGRYDVFHFHWPETLLGGSTPLRAFVRRVLFAALLVRLRWSRTAIVRTVHNVELPSDVTRWERRMLQKVQDRSDFLILLNAQSEVGRGIPSVVIPHGDFREWFRALGVVPRPPESAMIAFVGLVRRYKGVEQLITAFRATDRALRLHVAGNPSTPRLAEEITALASGDERISFDLRFLTEEEFAGAVIAAEGVVLPYRFMHNSGTVLAALSLDRPVLVPRTEVNEALSAEVGPGWITMFDGELTTQALDGFLPATRSERTASAPDLSARTWESVGARHRAAYEAAVRARRANRG